jgi:crossover junction endodeoxyribonuclease RuvC
VLILGIDPGSVHTGYGLVTQNGSRLETVACDRISCPRGMAVPQRLAFLSQGLAAVLADHTPDLAVLESPFHGLNPRSLIVLAQARGALIARLAGAGIEVLEYTPAEIKSAVTGNGRAGKQQVAKMVRLLLNLRDEGLAEDTTDALAAAICCARRHRMDSLAARRSGALNGSRAGRSGGRSGR